MRKLFKKRNSRVKALELQVRFLVKEVKELKDFMQVAKNIKQEQTSKNAQKIKWLRGNPDDTKKHERKTEA